MMMMMRQLLIIPVMVGACPFGESGIDTRGMCNWVEDIEVNCENFRVRAGLWGSGLSPALELTTVHGRVVVEPHHVANGSWPAGVPPWVVCVRGSEPSKPTVVMVANSFQYLFRLWPYFVHKMLWARQAGMPVAIRIGQLPPHLATTNNRLCLSSREREVASTSDFEKRFGGGSRSWYDGQERAATMNSNHHTKMLAALSVLPHAGGIFYLDLDVVPNATENQRIVDIHRDEAVDLLFARAETDMWWRVKGFMFYARRATSAILFLATWLANRCGFKDQYSLWHTLLEMGLRANCFDYKNELYLNLTYKDIRSDNASTVLQNFSHLFYFPCSKWRARCPQLRYCDDKYQLKSGFRHHTIQAARLRVLNYSSEGRWHTAVFQDMFHKLDDISFARFLGLDEAPPDDFF